MPDGRDANAELPRRGAWRRMLGAFRRNGEGVAAMEFAILALPFFLTVYATLETSMVFLAELTLDNAVDGIARQIRTGEMQRAQMSEADFRKAICDDVSFLLKCDGLQIDLKVYDEFSDLPPPSPIEDGEINSEGFDFEPGGPESITALRVYYKWPITTDLMRSYLSNMKDGSHLLFSMAAFRTEPF